MEWITDPSIWMALATLTTLEIVLGIDNLVFIAILSDKLPPEQKDKARILGLTLALLMRLLLLASLSYLLQLTQPLISLAGHTFSGKDLILLVGGLFLLFKASIELTDRVEGNHYNNSTQPKQANFWTVVTQIIVLDAVFSIDSVITAIHIAGNNLPLMMVSVTIAMIIMLFASKWLTRFVNRHPSIIILCLSFLLIIGFSLVAEGFGQHIPKEYLYFAIAFSILIESLNQLAHFNRKKYLSSKGSMRERTADAVIRLLSGKPTSDSELHNESSDKNSKRNTSEQIFTTQELHMIERVMGLAKRSVSSIMTSRHNIEFLNLNDSPEEQLAVIESNTHSRLVITEDTANSEPIGIIHVNDILKQRLTKNNFLLHDLVRQPLIFPETVSILMALEQFRQAHTHVAFVSDEFGSVEGLVTLTDVMETIAGNLQVSSESGDTRYSIQQESENSWIVHGYIPLEDLALYISLLLDEKREYHTLAGLLMEHTEDIPTKGQEIDIGEWHFKILEAEGHRILKVHVSQNTPTIGDKS